MDVLVIIKSVGMDVLVILHIKSVLVRLNIKSVGMDVLVITHKV